MDYYARTALQMVDRMGPSEWAVVLAGVILVGLLALRGYGSRSGY